MIDAILIGAGQRGTEVYAGWARRHPDSLRIVGVAEPDPDRRAAVQSMLAVPSDRAAESWEMLLEGPRLAEACIVATPDRLHHAPVAAALDRGYHTLVEKPLGASAAECVDLVRRAAASDGSLSVSHVLRYTPFFRTLHRVVAGGELGDIVSVEHRENVVAWHMAHSFVRGNWSRADLSTPMIVQKTCHDLDILTWNSGSPVVSLTSTGSLYEFRPERAPAGATGRCTDPCPVDDCPYDARRVYLRPEQRGWPVSVISADPSVEARLRALQEGPYGVCAYRAGSDAVDHQVVTMTHGDGTTSVLHLNGHSHEEARTMRYDGTRATLRAVFGRTQAIEVIDHAGGRRRDVPIETVSGGHGGGDHGVMASFVDSVAAGTGAPTDAAGALESHLLAFAAEQARLDGTRIELDAFRIRAGAEA